MKKRLLLVAIAVTLAIGSALAQTSNNGTTSAPKDVPVVGMTKAKAQEYYGKPFTQMPLEQGERWYYRLKFGEVYGRAFVPFYFDSPNVRWGSIDFGADGRVKGYDWQRVALR